MAAHPKDDGGLSVTSNVFRYNTETYKGRVSDIHSLQLIQNRFCTLQKELAAPVGSYEIQSKMSAEAEGLTGSKNQRPKITGGVEGAAHKEKGVQHRLHECSSRDE